MRARRFEPADAGAWDALVEAAPMATFLHTRRFLSYHGDRFEDASVVIADERGALQAVLPAAIDPGDETRVISHPGATYGGLIHAGKLFGAATRGALETIAAHYAERGLRTLGYSAVPHIYHRAPSADDVWAIAELGGTRVGVELSCALDPRARRAPHKLRTRSLAKARRAGVEVRGGAEPAEFWPLLEESLGRRHSARPVHTLAEIELLRSRFPAEIEQLVAVSDGRVVAGLMLFRAGPVNHVQYMASSEAGMQVNAQDALVEAAIELAAAEGARWFDLGTSSAPGRRGLNEDLYRFKAGFGGGGVVHEHYELPLAR